MVKNTNIQISSDKHKTIALLSDIHYTKNYSKKRLKEIYLNLKQKTPNYICIAGDFLDQGNVLEDMKTKEIFLAWLQDISLLAPIFIAIGNHDVTIKSRQNNFYFSKENIKEIASIPNIYVLDNNAIVKDDICFLGYTPPYAYYDKKTHEQVEPYIGDIDQKLKPYLNASCYQILLCHTPVYVTHPKVCATEVLKSVNLVLCGHMHKGIISLPNHYGLISPSKKFFPKYAWGDFEIDKTKYIISGGIIAFSKVAPLIFHPFNFFHPPHIEYIYL